MLIDTCPFELETIGFEEFELRKTSILTQADVDWLFALDEDCFDVDEKPIVGIAPCLNDLDTKLEGIAFAYGSEVTTHRVLFVQLDPSWLRPKAPSMTMLGKMLVSTKFRLAGFEFAANAMVIRHYTKLDVAGLDLSTVLKEETERLVFNSVKLIMGLSGKSLPGLVALWQYNSAPEEADMGYIPFRAWIAFACAVKLGARLQGETTPMIDTRRIYEQQVDFFCRAIRINNRLNALKNVISSNDFSRAVINTTQAKIRITNSKFMSKVRCDEAQQVRLTCADGTIIIGVAEKVKGTETTITTTATNFTGEIVKVEVIGRPSATNADLLWLDFMRQALQGKLGVYDSAINTKVLWHKGIRVPDKTNGAMDVTFAENELCSKAYSLNASQREAHDRILKHCRVKGAAQLVQGPPGCGKTSVISAVVQSWVLQNDRNCIFCVTASNVAAKNIGEALVKSGFTDFRLIVSNDFKEEWHDHLYGKNLEKFVIPSNQLYVKDDAMAKLMGGARVILCTLAMLCSQNLARHSFFSMHKLRTLLIDEASSIRDDEYPHVFDRFKKSLFNVAFFGDGQQLPPYSSSEISEIRSVFDLLHLRKDSLFLDTQYRMPSRLAAFISEKVYDGKLASGDNVSTVQDCVRFIDVATSCEEEAGKSKSNRAEVDCILELVAKFYQNHKSFRILTPYDGQRNAIEKALKQAQLPWEDRVFNIDPFQGQEADVILISVVRTDALGFLREKRRSNVMLTRTKKAMIVVCNRDFLERRAHSTLVGQLAANMGPQCWINAASLKEMAPTDLPEGGTEPLEDEELAWKQKK